MYNRKRTYMLIYIVCFLVLIFLFVRD